ncbi:DUF6207 family protein [Streptomyces sp. NPDC057950]|uniref:DUF6207 family protein n=1 Tax=Streptomyces sp. NPDC057950 TaxID=3346288 RepID=UPI0036E9F026
MRRTLGVRDDRCAPADDPPASAFRTAPATMWAATSMEHTTHGPRQPGVRLRRYLDLRQLLGPWPAPTYRPARSCVGQERRPKHCKDCGLCTSKAGPVDS